MNVGYVVSRFPVVSEVWIVREMDGIETLGHRIELFAMSGRDDESGGVVHESAWRWSHRAHRPSRSGVLAALAYWLRRRPLRTLATILGGVAPYAVRPVIAAKAAVTVLMALEQARVMQGRVEHVHAHFATYPALAAWVTSRLTGLPYSFTAHAHDLYVHRLHLRGKVREAAFAVAISEYNRGLLGALGTSTPVHVVHCGIDPGAIAFRARSAPAAPLNVVCVAALRPKKGHRFLFEALRTPGCPDVRLRLVGDGPERPELERLAGELGVADRLEFVGAVAEERVCEELDRADVFVLPSIVLPDGDTEGIPVVLMEAMAAGLPVIATTVSGVPELVVDGETGLLVAPGDPSALASAIRRVVEDWDAATARARAARRHVEERFDAARSAEALGPLFERGAAY